MTIVDDLTPTQCGLGRGKLIVRGKTVATLDVKLHVTFYNASDQKLDDRYVNLPLTDPQKQALIDAVASALSDLEAQTGLTRYTEPEVFP